MLTAISPKSHVVLTISSRMKALRTVVLERWREAENNLHNETAGELQSWLEETAYLPVLETKMCKGGGRGVLGEEDRFV